MTKVEFLERLTGMKIGQTFEVEGTNYWLTGLIAKGNTIKLFAIPEGCCEHTLEKVTEWREANEAQLHGKFGFLPGEVVATGKVGPK